MKEEDKYYTPTIEEFHVGFEYEVEDLSDNFIDRCWRKEKCDSVPIFIREWINQDEVRVKYLDKEDIENLGWEKVKYNTVDCWNIGIFHLFWFGNSIISINIRKITASNQIFRGYIKNKSELIKLMKQLGINDK